MTRKGPASRASPDDSRGRLGNARAYRTAAEDIFALLDEGGNANPVHGLAVLSAIAYADALTARFGDLVNRKDHSALVQALRDCLRDALPTARARDLAHLVEHKDEVHYGVRVGRRAEAERMLQRLRDFGDWAERKLGDQP